VIVVPLSELEPAYITERICLTDNLMYIFTCLDIELELHPLFRNGSVLFQSFLVKAIVLDASHTSSEASSPNTTVLHTLEQSSPLA